MKPQRFELGDLEIDLEARRVSRGGEEIALGRLSFDLLQALLEAFPAALSTDEIVEKVWQGNAISDETIKQRVSLLRRALGSQGDRENIETLRGFGYRLGIEPSARPRLPNDVAAPAPERGLLRWILLSLALVALLLVITLLATAVRQIKRIRPGQPDLISSVSSRTAEEPTLCPSAQRRQLDHDLGRRHPQLYFPGF